MENRPSARYSQPVTVSIRPDSTIRLNLLQLIAVIFACLSGAFVSGVAYTKITNHIEDPNHPTSEQITEIQQRLAVIETTLKVKGF